MFFSTKSTSYLELLSGISAHETTLKSTLTSIWRIEETFKQRHNANEKNGLVFHSHLESTT